MRALCNSSRVISAWDDDKLVNPEYQGRGIASNLLRYLLDEYEELLYIDVIPDEKQNVRFYEKYGFKIMGEGTA